MKNILELYTGIYWNLDKNISGHPETVTPIFLENIHQTKSGLWCFEIFNDISEIPDKKMMNFRGKL